MRNRRLPFAFLAPAALLLCLAGPAAAWDLNGTKTIVLHGRDGQAVPIGTVDFTPDGKLTAFAVKLDARRFKDFFLSMKEFKCLEVPTEIQCHVPYPYRNPRTVSGDDFTWLEHSLLFLHKSPKEFGAKLWNGLYYRLEKTEHGLVGTPQAIDLNQIGAPPADPDQPPYGPAERSEIDPGSRWFERLTIE